MQPFHNSCEVYSTEVMTHEGWHTLDEEQAIFELAAEGHNNQTFLRWLGGDSIRRQLQQRLILVHFACAIPASEVESDPNVLLPCAALRVGWVPGAMMITNGSGSAVNNKKNDRQNYLIIGLSLGVLGLMYVMALMIYLRTRSAQRRKRSNSSVSKSSSSPQTQTSCVERGEEESFSDTGASVESAKIQTTYFNSDRNDDENYDKHQHQQQHQSHYTEKYSHHNRKNSKHQNEEKDYDRKQISNVS